MNGMRAVPSPSGSNLPAFFRWCLGGMPAFASGSGSASARDASVAGASVLEFAMGLEKECDDYTASQLELLACANFLEEEEDEEEEGEPEVFSTPPLTQQDPQRQGQSQRGQAVDGEDGIAMCSVPLTQTQRSTPSPASSASPSSSPPSDSRERVASKPRKPRICMRKVRCGAKTRTPTPTPTPTPMPMPMPSPSPRPELDPLARMVLMIPTAPLPTTGDKDILELARRRGIL